MERTIYKVWIWSRAAFALMLLHGCLDGSPKKEDGGDKKDTPTQVVGVRVDATPFTPPGAQQATETAVTEKDSTIALWKTRMTVLAGALSAPASMQLTLVPGGVTSTPQQKPVSPNLTFKMTRDGSVVARTDVGKSIIVETIIDRVVQNDDVIVLLVTAPGTPDEKRFAIAPQNLTITVAEDGSRLVTFAVRDTDFAYSVMASKGAAFPPGYSEFTQPPSDPSALSADSSDAVDEPSEAHLTWTPGEKAVAGHLIAVAYDGATPALRCTTGAAIDESKVTSIRTNFPVKIYTDEFQATGLSSGKPTAIRICSANDRDPPDVSSGVVVSFDLPDRAAATLSGTPAAVSNASALAVTVGGTNVVSYQHALLADSTSCEGATYSDWKEVSVGITDSLTGEGVRTLCVLGKISDKNTQVEATRYSWTRDLTPPGAFTITTPTTPTNDTTPTLTWAAASTAVKYDFKITSDAGCATAVEAKSGLTDLTATTSALAQGSYYVCVSALDGPGNSVAATNNAQPIEIDVTPPTFTSLALSGEAVDGYLNLAERSGTQDLGGTLTASGYSSAAYALATNALACDGSLTYGAMPKSDATGFGADGLYKICVRLTDAATNVAYGASGTILLDTAVPTFTAMSYANDASNGFVNAAERSNTSDLGTAATGTGFDQARYKLTTSASTCNASLAYTTTIPKSNSADFGADGTYKICVELTDIAGNPTVYGSTSNVTLDTDVPNVTAVTSPTTNGEYTTSASIQIDLTLDEIATLGGSSGNVLVKLETGSTDRDAAYASGSGTTTLSFTYTVQAGDTSADLDQHATAPQISYSGDRSFTDAAGNPLAVDLAGASSLAAAEALVIDTTPPSAFSISAPSAASTISDNTPTITWGTATGATKYDVKVDDTSGCGSPVQTYNDVAGTSQSATLLADGAYFVCVTAEDGAGNATLASNDNLTFTVATGNWSALTATGEPDARKGHTGIFDGAKIIFWGGNDGTAHLNSGGIYDPAGNSWTDTDIADADLPEERSNHTATWTGAKMVVWGGGNGVTPELQSGGVFDPVGGDKWTPTTNTGAPSARTRHSAVWSGSSVIVFGGHDGTSVVNTGGLYDVALDSWTATDTSDPDLPAARDQHTAVWTGSLVLVWGGHDGASRLNSGARYDPTGPGGNYWTPISTTGAPSARTGHTAIWTGSKMIIFGGYDGTSRLQTGAVYDPAGDTWTAVTTTDAPIARDAHVAVWDDFNLRMIVYAGYDGASYLSGGAAYDPTGNAWVVPALDALGAPSARRNAAAAWTGSTMILFGGEDGNGVKSEGHKLTP